MVWLFVNKSGVSGLCQSDVAPIITCPVTNPGKFCENLCFLCYSIRNSTGWTSPKSGSLPYTSSSYAISPAVTLTFDIRNFSLVYTLAGGENCVHN